MVANNKLIEKFFSGYKSGRSTNMKIEGNRLVAYNWAIYAKRLSKNSYILYTGWKGFSHTTSKHINAMMRIAKMSGAKIRIRRIRLLLKNRNPFAKSGLPTLR